MNVETSVDLEVVLQNRLQMDAKEFQRYFDVEEGDDKIVVRIHRNSRGKPAWLERKEWLTVNNYVKEQGGAWVPSESLWEIPKPKPTSPTTGTPSIPVVEPPPPSQPTPFDMLPIDAISSMPFQSRTTEDPELDELVESVKAYGILEPILVRRKPSGLYEIVAGERRLKAARKAGLSEIPVVIKQLNDQEAYECQLIENVQRKDLADIEKARWLDYLLKKFPEAYPTQEALAKRIGKSRAWIANHLRMLQLPENIVSRETITEKQAREILAAPPEKREEIAKQIAETGKVPSSREIRRAVQPAPLLPVQCDNCPLLTINPKDYHGLVLCPLCYEQALQSPEKFAEKIKKPKREVERAPVTEEPKVIKAPETWEHRKARMETPVSRMDKAVFLEMQREGWNVEFQIEYCVLKTTVDIKVNATPDGQKVNAGIYLDGEEAHEGREERDEQLRELLAKRHGIRVVPISYERYSESALREVMEQIREEFTA